MAEMSTSAVVCGAADENRLRNEMEQPVQLLPLSQTTSGPEGWQARFPTWPVAATERRDGRGVTADIQELST